MPIIPPTCRAVLFDAVGTLLHPEPSAGAVYAEAGRQFGSRLAGEVIAARFRRAFGRQEELDGAAGHRTDETRELARWRAIVAEVLDDVNERESCFHHLYQHFARPAAWRVDAAAGPVLESLQARGLALGFASNFDHRLRDVVTGLPELTPLRHLIISSEIGWRKPAVEFFQAICRTVGHHPSEVLIVGDDLANDYDGARNAGLPAVLLDATGRSSHAGAIACLSELLR